MGEYVALLRIGDVTRAASSAPIAAAARACRQDVAGVRDAAFDSPSGALLVRFDRGLASVADIVRCLEDHGLTIVGVAQHPAPAADSPGEH
jgi:hypothetical protein